MNPLRKVTDWYDRLSPWAQNVLLASALILAAWFQIWMSHKGFVPEIHADDAGEHGFMGALGKKALPERPNIYVAYITTVLVFLPLIVRKRWPWVAFIGSLIPAMYYFMFPWGPSFAVIGPMVAVYSVAQSSEANRKWLIGIVGFATAGCLSALYLTSARWAIELVGVISLLSVAAFFGDSNRSMRAFAAEAEARLIELDRAREEEALRRVESERVEIAREVHDIVAHSLSVVSIQAMAAETLVASDQTKLQACLATIRETSTSALSEIRSMLSVLRGVGDEGPLNPTAVLENVDDLLVSVRATGINVIYLPQFESIPASVSVSAYRIIQESLTNVMRHSNANKVLITITEHDSALSIDIKDNGTKPPVASEDGSGHGLMGIRERCEALRGVCVTGYEADGEPGFRVHVSLPLGKEVL